MAKVILAESLDGHLRVLLAFLSEETFPLCYGAKTRVNQLAKERPLEKLPFIFLSLWVLYVLRSMQQFHLQIRCCWKCVHMCQS